MRDAQLRQGTELSETTPVMQRLRQEIDLVARSDFTVLITGETGTGKELVARGPCGFGSPVGADALRQLRGLARDPLQPGPCR